MRIAVGREVDLVEDRVAATPETVKKMTALGAEVAVEPGAGVKSGIPDAEFIAAGATVSEDAVKNADVVLRVRRPVAAELAHYKKGALVFALMDPYGNDAALKAMADAGVTAFAMELMPRITRAQSMDVLSSQANLAGYRAVIEAAGTFTRGFPMMMTAAGTVPPARVFVIGAGVAGLQAIATARRLGAIVSATDVRPAAKEEIKSLGATFVGVEDEETAAQKGAYAGQMSEAFLKKQAELVGATAAKNDIVICTALVMGRKAPTLLTAAMVEGMKAGSVVIDLAADAGGNCALTQPGASLVTPNGVTILGWRNWPGRIAVASSALYARNLLTFLTSFWDKEGRAPKLPEADEIVRGTLLTRAGSVVHPQFAPKAAA